MKKNEYLERALDVFRPAIDLAKALGMDLDAVCDHWYDTYEISYIERDYFKKRLKEDE